MAQDPAEYYRGLSALYGDAIQRSDFKANIVMFFMSIVLGPVMGSISRFPPFLSTPVVMTPFLVVFFCLFVTLLQRYPRRGAANLLVSRTASAQQFKFDSDPQTEVLELRLRCAILSDILYWKTVCLRIAFAISIAGVIASTVLLIYYGLIVKS
jgi:hypothetical protein